MLHKIYSSAREIYTGGVTGRSLFEKACETAGGPSQQGRFYYVEEPDDAVELLQSILRPGDLFITMGAGDNWRLGKKLFCSYDESGASQ